MWRKVQSCCLASMYVHDEGFSLSIQHLSALAFLRFEEISEAFEEPKPHLPEQARGVIEWFEVKHVHTRIRTHLQNDITALSLPSLWSVLECMESAFS
ncbi:hypothetical protein M514_23811 [Trichuris suis]|uniref:Uncharacterized protein n=1 Tax=Trichuris suis TaxID=68888 RepID=A0A085N3B7_9BILA|nr:hypothetical protein M514_23811 [Trichuris suis]